MRVGTLDEDADVNAEVERLEGGLGRVRGQTAGDRVRVAARVREDGADASGLGRSREPSRQSAGEDAGECNSAHVSPPSLEIRSGRGSGDRSTLRRARTTVKPTSAPHNRWPSAQLPLRHTCGSPPPRRAQRRRRTVPPARRLDQPVEFRRWKHLASRDRLLPLCARRARARRRRPVAAVSAGGRRAATGAALRA
jgi:hypothetical protein